MKNCQMSVVTENSGNANLQFFTVNEEMACSVSLPKIYI